MTNLRLTFGFLFAATMVLGQDEPSSRSLLDTPLVTLESEATADANVRLAVGMKRGVLVEELGEPSLQLSRDLWIYPDFHVRNLPHAQQRGALVVVFVNDAVSHMRLTDPALVRAIIARQKQLVARPASSSVDRSK